MSRIVLKKASPATAGRKPLAADLAFGEVAINPADGMIYTARDTGGGAKEIVRIGAVISDTLAAALAQPTGAGFLAALGGGAGGLGGLDLIEARAALGLGAHAVPVGLTGLSAVTIPGIPSWARSITVSLNDVRTNANGVIKFLRAVTGVSTVVTTGYTAGAAFGPATDQFSNNQTGFPLSAPNNSLATHDLSGSVTLTLHDAATNTWVLSGSLHSFNYGVGCFASGIITLPAPLTGIQILVGSGGTSFSQGSIAARWEA